MAEKYDGIVESVRYTPDGRVSCVRVYERRGPAFSDRILLDREAFIQRLRTRKQFFTGKRLPYLGGTFKTGSRVTLVGSAGQEWIVSGAGKTGRDFIEDVPFF
jgi:hypothetical protein